MRVRGGTGGVKGGPVLLTVRSETLAKHLTATQLGVKDFFLMHAGPMEPGRLLLGGQNILGATQTYTSTNSVLLCPANVGSRLSPRGGRSAK